MTLSRWRRIATGIAAGVIVLCAALIGASFRDTSSGVAVASDLRTPSAIPIPEIDEEPEADPAATDDAVEVDASTDGTTTDEAPAEAEADDEVAAAETTADAVEADAGDADDAADATESVTVIETEDLPADDADTAEPDATEADTTESDGSTAADEPVDDAPADTSEDSAPLTTADDALGTGGGVDDAECALDRLVIYAGARVGGVAGQLRSALSQAGFGAGCPTPVTVLASNCPLQFAGVLGTDSGYDPATSYVAASASVDRETMTAVMGEIGFSGNAINILDFSFVNADKPGEQWMAIFIPPSFDGWENLAGRAGLTATTRSLCAPSGELAG